MAIARPTLRVFNTAMSALQRPGPGGPAETLGANAVVQPGILVDKLVDHRGHWPPTITTSYQGLMWSLGVGLMWSLGVGYLVVSEHFFFFGTNMMISSYYISVLVLA